MKYSVVRHIPINDGNRLSCDQVHQNNMPLITGVNMALSNGKAWFSLVANLMLKNLSFKDEKC